MKFTKAKVCHAQGALVTNSRSQAQYPFFCVPSQQPSVHPMPARKGHTHKKHLCTHLHICIHVYVSLFSVVLFLFL
ncbi:hypothetical_protein_-_conserved [Leishmania infantum]|uniref:Hypothetical_protein_-_conserved n=1 Tax=Leishmania infantum TaxID=5671 RepID=A0A6L0XWP7_LEIIN|nr:hypothetical_protein_-_conserved [Leishmania infantum]SUZ44245.1 hypothetical_protein_-_conserved [Leishmania infantum]